jgi:hypothetical protein
VPWILELSLKSSLPTSINFSEEIISLFSRKLNAGVTPPFCGSYCVIVQQLLSTATADTLDTAIGNLYTLPLPCTPAPG